MTMCVWRHFGTAGGLETQNFLCLLSTNIIIEKIFVFLWFWLVFLLLCSMGNFLYYSLLILSKNDNVRKVPQSKRKRLHVFSLSKRQSPSVTQD